MDKIKRHSILVIYLLVVILIYGLTPFAINLRHAGTFDKYYSLLLIFSIAIYGCLFAKKELGLLLKHLILIAVVLSGVATIIFYILSKMDIWFLFERAGKTWLGFAGATVTFLYAVTGILAGLILGFFRNKIFYK